MFEKNFANRKCAAGAVSIIKFKFFLILKKKLLHKVVQPKLSDFGELNLYLNEFCRKIFLHSLKVTPFHCLLRPKTQKSNGKNAFWIFLKSGPKFSNFGLKSAIFGRFSKFFFPAPTTHRDTHFVIK